MGLLISGLLLWAAAHAFKRIAPAARARLGAAGQGLVAVAIVAAIVLMVYGYRATEPRLLWALPAVADVVNNVAMLVALYLFVGSNMPVALRRHLRHPQLSGVIVWALAHLLVKGESGALVLFGGLAAWAVLEMVLINRAEGEFAPPEIAVSAGREVMLVVITLVAFALIGWAHAWLGAWPFVIAGG